MVDNLQLKIMFDKLWGDSPVEFPPTLWGIAFKRRPHGYN